MHSGLKGSTIKANLMLFGGRSINILACFPCQKCWSINLFARFLQMIYVVTGTTLCSVAYHNRCRSGVFLLDCKKRGVRLSSTWVTCRFGWISSRRVFRTASKCRIHYGLSCVFLRHCKMGERVENLWWQNQLYPSCTYFFYLELLFFFFTFSISYLKIKLTSNVSY